MLHLRDETIHRQMRREHEYLCKVLGLGAVKMVSDVINMIASFINVGLNVFRAFDIGGNIRAFREDLVFNKNKAFCYFAKP